MDNTSRTKDIVYSSAKSATSYAIASIAVVGILAGLSLILPHSSFLNVVITGGAMGACIAVCVMLLKRSSIRLSCEGLALRRCASVNGKRQKELRLAWADIKKVRCQDEGQATITLNDGSQLEVRLKWLCPTYCSLFFHTEEIVQRMEQYVRKAKASK